MFKVRRGTGGPCLAPGGSVLTIGAFDGLHRGHIALLSRVRERANALGATAAAVTFEPLPRSYFAPAPMGRLSSLREKLCGFAGAGIECLLLLRFDASLAAMTAEDFVERVLVARMAAREIWVGADFRFGHDRVGDVALLRQAGAYRVRVLEAVSSDDDQRVSASRVRRALAAGDFAHAADLLGRPFTIGGRVAHGRHLGDGLGYPTANLRLGGRVPPITGIFAVRAEVAGQWLPGVASLGTRPTVASSGEPLLEVYLFDFAGDLYGQRLTVEFVAKLRDEKKFPGLDALRVQMDQDAARAREVLGVATARSDASAAGAPRRTSGSS